MGYREDWDRVKLLGDAYYDNLLIEQTLIEKLGTRLINGISGSELTRRLIDNATTAKEDSPGLLISIIPLNECAASPIISSVSKLASDANIPSPNPG